MLASALLLAVLGASPETAEQALQQHGIVLLRPGDWDAPLVEALYEGLQLLPPAMRDVPGGPLELVSNAEPAPFGMGDGDRLPEWSDGRRRFHLYAFSEPADEARAQLRLERLDEAERERLWRRRALIHAVVQRWDDALGLSRRNLWRRLNVWLAPFDRVLTFREEALNRFEGAYSRRRGMASASLDLVTFAEELFASPETIRPGAVDPVESLACQEFGKSRALLSLLHEHGLAPAPRDPSCSAFERWARLDELESVEVLLVASSGRAPESIFGHILLRPVYASGTRLLGPSFAPVVQIAALTGPDDSGPSYLWNGFTGGFSTVVLTSTMGEVAHQSLRHEQRTIRRFRLELTAEERRRVMERVWELERRGYFGYYFFTDNCAAVLVHLINGALPEDRQISLPGRFFTPPTATLDEIAAIRVSGDRPLMTQVPEPFESTRDIAERSNEELIRIGERIGQALPGEMRRRFTRLLRHAHSPVVAERAAAWPALEAIFEARLSGPASLEEREAIYAWLLHAVRIERHALERALAAQAEVEIARLLPDGMQALSSAEQVLQRQRDFARETEIQRRLAMLDREEAHAIRLEHAPKRPPTDEERRIIDQAAKSETAFRRLTDVQARLVQRHFALVDAGDWLERERLELRTELATRAATSLPASGYWRTRPAIGARIARGGARPLLALRNSGLYEHLGDQRVRGFQSSSQMHVLDGELRLTLGDDGWPALAGSEFTVFGYRTLQRDPPILRRTFVDELGWGGAMGWEARPERSLPQRGLMHLEALAVIDAGPRFLRLLAVGLGATGQLRWTTDRAAVGIGPRLALTSRLPLPGHSANALRIEGLYQPALLVGAASGWVHETSVGGGFDVRIPLGAKRALLIGPRVRFEWEKGAGQERGPELLTTLGLELI